MKNTMKGNREQNKKNYNKQTTSIHIDTKRQRKELQKIKKDGL